MGQAKNRKAEIMALKANGPKFKAKQSGFLPDAGLNSTEGTNHYWFQIAELMSGIMSNTKGMRGYTHNGVNVLEVNATVDIMDHSGKEHTAPHTEDGYFATLRFTADGLDHLANEIDKGAMSVRVSGIPSETETSPVGEKFRVIDATDSWSAGNNSGSMAYMFTVNNQFVTIDSGKVANKFREIANQVRAK